MMLRGRLGLETARVPHADRSGLLWIGRGRLHAEDGNLHFLTAGDGDLPAGAYDIPYQSVSCLMLQPGTTITHDALRLLARHGTGAMCVASGGVRLYASMPFGPDDSALARRQATWWADRDLRIALARRMYAWRLGEVLPVTDIDALRGIEGARMKATYKHLAQQFGIPWGGRNYDRQAPDCADIPNQAINHTATAVVALAQVATAATGAIPQLGFIHEESGIAFALDVADLFRDTLTVPMAFAAARACAADPKTTVESEVRRLAGIEVRRVRLVARMIERINELLRADTLVGQRPAPPDLPPAGPNSVASLVRPQRDRSKESTDADDTGSDA